MAERELCLQLASVNGDCVWEGGACPQPAPWPVVPWMCVGKHPRALRSEKGVGGALQTEQGAGLGCGFQTRTGKLVTGPDTEADVLCYQLWLL